MVKNEKLSTELTPHLFIGRFYSGKYYEILFS